MGGFDGQRALDGADTPNVQRPVDLLPPLHELPTYPVLPSGRHVRLPGRGRTFVRELSGPEGAPTVVLLHGWTATSDLNWSACYGPLAEHFRVIALDHRGHGRGIRATAPFRLEDCADDVAALADQLDIDRLVAVGYSMGGPVAQLLWRRHRRLVDGLVLCATSCTFSGTVRERLLSGVAVSTGALADALPLERMANASLAAWHHWRCRRGRPWWGYEDVARHDWSEIVGAGRELLRYDSRSWLGAIDVPAAVVVTAGDDVVPVRRQLAMAGRLCDARQFTVDGGHAVCTTDPTRFVPTLVEACCDVTSRARSRARATAA